MRKQAGQALILVLILLAIGALLVVPSLRLTGTALMNSPIVERQTKGLYAADAAQEYILWNLLDINWRNQYVGTEDVPFSFKFNVCDVPVSASVIMRAVVSEGGTVLATEDKIKPEKTVTLSEHVYGYQIYTYEIELDYLSEVSEENPLVYLDAIYDIPPSGFGKNAYQEGSSKLSLDGGETWWGVPNPEWSHSGGYLKWPAEYEWNPDVTGTFSSNPLFLGMEEFEVREVKILQFKMAGTLADANVHCNNVILKMADGTNTVSSAQAPISVGLDEPGDCSSEGLLKVEKSAKPQFIQPGEPTPVTYTLKVTNMDGRPHDIEEVIDYLPKDFHYIDGTVDAASTLTASEPAGVVPVTLNGILREKVYWTQAQFPQGNDRKIDPGETLTIIFQVLAIKDLSGSYYNEVIVDLKDIGIQGSAFAAAGVSSVGYSTAYSWETGAVMVPAYDSTSEAEGVTINANMALILQGITITSWGVD